MRKSFTLFVIIIGFLGLFVSQSLSFSTATLEVNTNLSITDNHQGLITADDLYVHMSDQNGDNIKGQDEVVRITNHMNVPISVSEDDVYPLADDNFFHIIIQPVTIPAGHSADVGLTVFAHKNKTPIGDYEFPIQIKWDTGSSEIPLQLHLDNDLN